MENTESTILLVDDDPSVTDSLRRSLERRDSSLNIVTASTSLAAETAVATHRPHVAVLDLTLDPKEGPSGGLKLISALLLADPALRILVLTGHGDESTGVEAIQRGAASFITKPPALDHLLALILDGIEYSNLKRAAQISIAPSDLFDALGLTTRSAAMGEALKQTLFAASHSLPTLILGETGTGKGLVAQAIHRASASHRGPFIRCQPNFGNPDLVSSELFGHERGAFPGAVEQRVGLIEAADKGTLFIDEIDELPQDTQVTLLHVLQERCFRRVGSLKERKSQFRLLVASNQPLERLAKEKLRPDFFHRIAHTTIALPPLRDRKEDIPDLVQQFIIATSSREKLAVHGITPDALTRLRSYAWPGNVRELQAVVENAAHRANFERRPMIADSDLRIVSELSAATVRSFRTQVDAYELRLIEDALKACDGNQSQAAEQLQLDRSTLRRILSRATR